jgi:small nuclear ribonucleoprotein (snRNP)-like protein
MASAKGVGIPVKLLHEAEGHVITVELKSGENYRGELIEAEDNWNCQMKNVQATAKVRGARPPAGALAGGAGCASPVHGG